MNNEYDSNKLRVLILCLIALIILGAGAGGAYWFISNKKKANRKKPKSLIPNVSVQQFERLDLETRLEAMGVVIPAKRLDLDARINGEIIKLNDNFMPGGIIKKGETLLYLDKADYQLSLKQAEANLEKAKSELKLEMAQGLVAKNQYERFANGTPKTIDDEELILRKPQERSRKADVAIAEANIGVAKLALERTEIKAPFDSVIISTDVELGDQVSTQSKLATLVGTETFWVRTSLPSSKLKWLNFPQDGKTGSEATVTTKSCKKKGTIIKLLRSLEEKGRMARVLVEIKDPLNLSAKDESKVFKNPLLLGEYSRIELKGKTIKDVVRVPRTALHEGNEIWVADAEDKLVMVKGAPIWEDRENIYFRQEIPPGCRLITSNFGFPVQGMKLNIVEGKEEIKTPVDVSLNGVVKEINNNKTTENTPPLGAIKKVNKNSEK